ncbi:MAG: N-acetylneuraminate lyase [Pseudomonadota bacterium]
MTDLNGFFAALPTPFSQDGSDIEVDALATLVVRNLDAGLAGLYVGGSTGEAFLMSVEERETVLRLAVDAAAGRGTMIAHVGDPNPEVSGRLARFAADQGYHAISAVPPFYYRYGIDEIAAHYGWLAGQTDLPFLIYNFPDLSGVRWSVSDLARLLDIPQIVGVKNTCGDLFAFETLRRKVPEKVLLHGFDETLLAGLALGADGGIGSTYNVQPERILALAAAHGAGQTDRARALQAEANGLIDEMIAVGVLPALKYLLSRQGIPMGACRKPFAPLSDLQRRKLDAAAEMHLFGESNGTRQAARG